MKVTMMGFHGTNTQGNHNKFYEAFEIHVADSDDKIYQTFLYRRYGKIGSEGKLSLIELNQSAPDVLKKLQSSKSNKGYQTTKLICTKELWERNNPVDDLIFLLSEIYANFNISREIDKTFRGNPRRFLASEIASHPKIVDMLDGMELFERETKVDGDPEPVMHSDKYENWGLWA